MRLSEYSIVLYRKSRFSNNLTPCTLHVVPPFRNNSDRPIVGISAVVAGLFLFSLQDVVIKFFSSEYSVLQIVIIRGLVAVVVVGMVVMALLGSDGFRIRQPSLIIVKGLLAFLSYLAYYMAIASLPLADVVAITFSAPIMVTVMSALLLKEYVGSRRWFAVIVGFTGVLFIVGPGGKIANIAVSFAAIAALTYALSSVIARFLGPDDKPWTVTFYFTVAHFVGGVIVSLLVIPVSAEIGSEHPSLAFLTRPWSTDNNADLLIMAALGVNAALGFYFLNKAYLSAPASKIAPFEYTYIMWAVFFGYVFWSELPAYNVVIGIVLLVGSNLYILHREIVNKRKRRKLQQAKTDQLVVQN